MTGEKEEEREEEDLLEVLEALPNHVNILVIPAKVIIGPGYVEEGGDILVVKEALGAALVLCKKEREREKMSKY